MTNMDKLYEAVEARGPVCVGLDTDFSYLPADFVDSTLTKGENIVRFNKKLIDATKAVAGCYKVQIAYYESLGMEGMKAYADTLKAVREAGVPVIADIKRGDIAKTAEMYAMGHFTGDFESDSSRWHPTWVWTPSAPTCPTPKSRARACSCSAAPPTAVPRTLNMKSWQTAATSTIWWATS